MIRSIVFGWGSFILFGWSTPPNTIFGPKPYEYHALRTADTFFLNLSFIPEEFLQKAHGCEGRYHLRLTIWQDSQLYYTGERSLTFRSTAPGKTHSPNLYVWPVRLSSLQPLYWLLECYDQERAWTWVVGDSSDVSFYPLFVSQSDSLFSFSDILGESRIILLAPAPITEVILYQVESTLPGTARYLSLQERRFIRRVEGRLDTLILDWRGEELRPGRYLVGIYSYRGREVVSEAFRPVTKRAWLSRKGA